MILTVTTLLLLFILTSSAPAEPVRIESGLVSGVPVGNDHAVEVFKGIAYAAPPVGDLRWKPPQPAGKWDDVRDCNQFGAKALQGVNRAGTNEDCLYLNVWTPAKAADEALPVMVWIHGGGLTSGSGHEVSYDGQHFARKGAVLVTINYRLGAMGFFAHPALTAESEHKSSGNYGILDQIAALKWVQKNIGAFGGDPDRVTIFGESAGGTSVYLLTATPLAKGLFHRAILQSAWLDPKIFHHLKENTFAGPSIESRFQRLAAEFVDNEDVNVLAALRKLPAQEVMNKFPGMNRVAVDGWIFPDFPHQIFADGKQNRVPTIAGTNRDEGSMFAQRGAKSVEEYEEKIGEEFGEQRQAVIDLYGVKEEGAFRDAEVQRITDVWFAQPTREFSRAMDNSELGVWMYHFTRISRSWPAGGAAHAAEIQYVFNTLDAVKMQQPDHNIADAMIGYWVQFAKTGDPNVEGLPAWPAFTRNSDQHLEIGKNFRVGTGLRREACDVLDRLLAAKRQSEPKPAAVGTGP